MNVQTKILRQVIEGVSDTFGDEFFSSICLQLARVIDADYVLIASADLGYKTSTTISFVVKGEVKPNITYSLENTPCSDVVNGITCCYPTNVSNLYPNDLVLKELNVESYVGTALRNSKGLIVGLIVAMNEKPLIEADVIVTLFEIFSGRIAAEIERNKYEQELRDLNVQLEDKVTQRTVELQTTLANLQLMHQQLVEADKMAALGNLVAGVSHEVNSPLGVAITLQSYMADELKNISESVSNKKLTIDHMNEFLSNMDHSLLMQERNLIRARDLIENFKRTAADQHSSELESINMKKYYEQVFSSLQPLINKIGAKFFIDIPCDLQITTYPGVHAQIITNLVTNSVQHGFEKIFREKEIILNAVFADDGYIEVSYRDNGVGLSEESKHRIFEPFFTTNRKDGGTGLGMSILYNLVTQSLGGSVKLKNEFLGFELVYRFQNK